MIQREDDTATKLRHRRRRASQPNCDTGREGYCSRAVTQQEDNTAVQIATQEEEYTAVQTVIQEEEDTAVRTVIQEEEVTVVQP